MILPYWPQEITTAKRIYRPLVPVHLMTASDVAFVWALADTGADQTLLPASVADDIGMRYDRRTSTTILGFGGQRLSMAFGTIDLVITEGDEKFQWSAMVGIVDFTDPGDEIAIIGHLGGLEFFRAIFDGEQRQLELVPQSSFPGTVTTLSA